MANGSLGHERNMLWLSYADRLQELVEDFRPSHCARPRPVRHAGHGQPGAAAARLGGAGARGARRRGRGGAVGAQTLRLGGLADRDRIRARRGGRRRPGAPELLRPRTARITSTSTGAAGSSATSAPSAAPSPAAPRRSNATSSPSGCWACPEIEELAVYIDYEVADRIATITLNRPEAANAQNTELLDELDAAWTRAAEDNDVAVIVLRANGKHFSAGHDLRGGGPVPDKITLEFIIQHESQALPRVHAALAQRPEAVDRRRAGPVHLRRPAAVLAVRPDRGRRRCAVLRPGGADGHRRRRIPRPHLGTRRPQGQGDPVHRPGDDRRGGASSTGMVNRVVPRDELDTETRALAEQIAKMPPFALRQAKRAVNQTLDVRASTRRSSRCSTSTRPATATR